FLPPGEGRPALLTHDDVLTLFHEFGHGLHHLLTSVDYPSLAGINGVAWDAVELPSQFLENYAWNPQVLQRISGHFESGVPLPANTQERLIATRSFHAGLSMMRQLEFSLFDFRIHTEYSPGRGEIGRASWRARDWSSDVCSSDLCRASSSRTTPGTRRFCSAFPGTSRAACRCRRTRRSA